MLNGHDPLLVMLSLAVSILGGYTGFGLAARIRQSSSANRRLLLTGAAAFLSVGIWTMHFVGMMAAPLPPDATYLVLPTVISFLICALVVGVSLFLVSIGEVSTTRILLAAVLLGIGIASMHYVGIHGLAGKFVIEHDQRIVALSLMIAIAAAYGGLRIYLAAQGGWRLALSAIAFGIAVSGMHYTAMAGMHFTPTSAEHAHGYAGLAASPQIVSLVVALLCFVIAAGFLLFLVPEPKARRVTAELPEDEASVEDAEMVEEKTTVATLSTPRRAAPLGGIGLPRTQVVDRVPVSSNDGTHLVEVADIRSIRADAHYTQVHDGHRERLCPWSISELEAKLDSARFMRVHRSHIVALAQVNFIRKEGDGAVVEVAGTANHLVPVSRSKIAEVRARLGLTRSNSSAPLRQNS